MAAPMMLSLIKYRLCFYQFCRCIHLSRPHYNDAFKSKYMKKLLDKEAKKNDKWFANAQVFPTHAAGSSGKTNRGHSERLRRRQESLGVYLFSEVSEIMSTGELGINVPLLQVELVPDYSAMKIFWEATGVDEDDAKIQERLNQAASKLRQELIKLKVMGRVPPIVFIRDLAMFKHRQLDKLFASLETGPPVLHDSKADKDCEDEMEQEIDENVEQHTDFQQLMKESAEKKNISTLTAAIAEEKLQSEIRAKTISKKKQKQNQSKETEVSNTPNSNQSYRQDLYGLQRDVLMNKVRAAKKSVDGFRPVVVSDGSEESIKQTMKFEDSHFNKKMVKPDSMRKQKRASRQMEEEAWVEVSFEKDNEDNLSRSVDDYDVDAEEVRFFAEDVINNFMEKHDQDVKFREDNNDDLEYK